MRTSWTRVMQGVVFLAVLAGLIGLTVLKFNRALFNDEVPVSVVLARAGTQLEPSADVKVRGIIVGRVAEQRSDGKQVTLHLRMSPSKIGVIPGNVQARLLPKTFFGEKFVELRIPPTGGVGTLQRGAVIREDRSADAIEIERVLDSLFELLRIVQPAKLNATLSAIADGLRDRGAVLGEALERTDAVLAAIDPRLGDVSADVSGLADLASSLDRNATDLLAIARDVVVTSTTIDVKQDDLAAFLRGTAGLADTGTRIMRRNGADLIFIAEASRRTLEAVAPKQDLLPGTVRGLHDLVTRLNQALGHGPALSIRIEMAPDRGGYTTPCQSYPDENYRGGCAVGGTPDSAGPPGSPEESATVRAIVGARHGMLPERVPDVALLLYAPLLRGHRVVAE